MASAPVGEFRRGWPMLVASATCYGLALSHLFTLGLFMEPLQAEFGWTRSEISGVLLMYTLIAVPGAPLVGWLVDRIGVRALGIGGMALYAASMAMLALLQREIWSWWLLYSVGQFAYLFCSPAVWVPAVSAQFNRRRGLALAIMFSGSGMAAFILPLTIVPLIDHLGWRAAYLVLGGVIALACLPQLFLVLPRGRLVQQHGSDHDGGGAEALGLSTREALRSSRFIRLFLVYLFFTGVLTGLNVHFVPMLTALGGERHSVALAASMIGIGSIAGRLTTGFLLDRSSSSMVGAVVMVPAVIAISALLLDEGGAWMPVVALLFGFAFGAEVDVVGYLSTRYFGLRNFGSIYGVMTAAAALATGFGPTLAGMTYDRFGNYEAYLIGGLVICAICTGLVASLGRYPDFAAPSASGDK